MDRIAWVTAILARHIQVLGRPLVAGGSRCRRVGIFLFLCREPCTLRPTAVGFGLRGSSRRLRPELPVIIRCTSETIPHLHFDGFLYLSEERCGSAAVSPLRRSRRSGTALQACRDFRGFSRCLEAAPSVRSETHASGRTDRVFLDSDLRGRSARS
jgi:hypothetical protein